MNPPSDYGEYEHIAAYYDHVTPYRERPDVDFFVEEALKAGSPVLEIGCGTGRILVPTAHAGIQITGLDLSADMLAVCRERLATETDPVRAQVELVQADMRDFDLGQRFNLVTLPFRPFQHLLTTQDQMACLKCIHSHLNPGGLLILDLFNPSIPALNSEVGVEHEDVPEFELPDGRRVVRRSQITRRDYFNQVNEVELIYLVTHPDGREERLVHAFSMRYLFRYEVEHLLARCGFQVENLYAGFDRAAYGSTYPGELIFLARHHSGL
jgi:SAM-dependent methyltransferase